MVHLSWGDSANSIISLSMFSMWWAWILKLQAIRINIKVWKEFPWHFPPSFIYVCVCVCTYTYTHIYLLSISIDFYSYISSKIYRCMCVCVYIYIFTYIYDSRYTTIGQKLYVYIVWVTYICIYTYIIIYNINIHINNN